MNSCLSIRYASQPFDVVFYDISFLCTRSSWGSMCVPEAVDRSDTQSQLPGARQDARTAHDVVEMCGRESVAPSSDH